MAFVEADGGATLGEPAHDCDVLAKRGLRGAKCFGFEQKSTWAQKALAVGLNFVEVAMGATGGAKAINKRCQHCWMKQRFELAGKMLAGGDGECRHAGFFRVGEQ